MLDNGTEGERAETMKGKIKMEREREEIKKS